MNPFATVSNNLPNVTDNKSVGKDLFNGNIRAMLVNIPKLGDANLYGYRYDQLNRITAMNTYTGLSGSNTFTALGTDNYRERISYDANGNILTYLRNGTTSGSNLLAMDDLTYHYQPGTNQLGHVDDAVSSGNYTIDIDDQNTFNYSYDEIGNLTSDVSEGITNIDWNVYGKIKSITKSTGTINYSYDASGNRISKTYNGKTTWYVRDASGNVMSVYAKDASVNNNHLTQNEVHLYGSSRLGILNVNEDLEVAPQPPVLIRGNKFFELSNHLGNVLVTISDKKLQIDDGNGNIDYYTADIVTANDYYPFGMMMVERKYTQLNSAYRYGFNGKERDTETTSTTTYDYGFRIYNPGLGKFLSVDPLTKSYPMLTPYQFASNRPIDGVDLDGLEYLTYTLVYVSDGQGPAVLQNSYIVWHNSQEHNSHGKLGRGVKYNIFIIDKKTKKQLFSESRFVSRNAKVLVGLYNADYGNYMGPTSLYKYGDGGYYNENFSQTYDYSLPAVDAVDNLAKLHDIGYDRIGAKGERSLMNDWATTPIDIEALKGWQEILINKDAYPDVNQKGRSAAINASTLFSYVATKKQNAISKFMRRNYEKEASKDVTKNYQLFLDKYMQQDSDGNWTRKEDMWHKDKEGDWKPNKPKAKAN